MDIEIRPFREADRSIIRDLTVAGFEGVSIDHEIDDRLVPVAGKGWRWRKARDVDRDIEFFGAKRGRPAPLSVGRFH
jgi:hypothetical protein